MLSNHADPALPWPPPDSHPESRPDSPRDVYFSADIETDGPIPGPFSMLSFALVYAGAFDGRQFTRPDRHPKTFSAELKPISTDFQPEALRVNGLDRQRLCQEGQDPAQCMSDAYQWITRIAGADSPVLVAYPLSFDWSWLYWYFIRYCALGSPFSFSRCFDIKTAFAVKASIPIAAAGRSKLPAWLRPEHPHTHRALDDAIAQAEIFANLFQWQGAHAHP